MPCIRPCFSIEVSARGRGSSSSSLDPGIYFTLPSVVVIALVVDIESVFVSLFDLPIIPSRWLSVCFIVFPPFLFPIVPPNVQAPTLLVS